MFLLTIFAFCFSVDCHYYYLGMFTVYLDFSEDMLQDKSNDVYGSLYVERCVFLLDVLLVIASSR